MKILFCINNLGVGGAERLVVDDINEMLNRGYHVRLLTLKNEPKFSLLDELKLPKKYRQTVSFSSFFNIFNWIKVFNYLRREKPNIVLTHLWFSNTIVRIVCKMARINNVFCFEHNIYDTLKSEKMYKIDRFLQEWSKKIIAVSSAVRRSLLKHGIKEKNIITINNGIVISKYEKSQDILTREKLGIPKDTFVFLTIGRLVYQKGIDILLKAFAEVNHKSTLLIVGHGKEEYNLKKLTTKLNIDNTVHFLGTRSDIPKILSICDCFVLASRFEGLGIVILEAMASKKPIIISDFEAGEDMIKNGVEGLVVPKENVESLKNAMARLKSDPNLMKKLAQSAYEKVQDFSIQNHVNKILNL